MGGIRKGFEPKKPDRSIAPPIDKLGAIATTVPRLEQLLAEILKYKLTPRTYGIIKRYAQLPPTYRLAVSLKTVISLLADKDITDIVYEGLTKDERDALIEIDGSGISLESRRTAHSLLDVDTRMTQLETFGRIFRDARTRTKHMLQAKLLD